MFQPISFPLPCPKGPGTRSKALWTWLSYRLALLLWTAEDYRCDLKGDYDRHAFSPWRIEGPADRTTLVVGQVDREPLVLALMHLRPVERRADTGPVRRWTPGADDPASAERFVLPKVARGSLVQTLLPRLSWSIVGVGKKCRYSCASLRPER